MCQPCILICGTRQFSDEDNKTSNNLNDEMLNNDNRNKTLMSSINGESSLVNNYIICPNCSSHTKLIYKKLNNFFTCCFIPICIMSSSKPYLTCPKCSFKLPEDCSFVECDVCSISYIDSKNNNYCPECGAKKYPEVNILIDESGTRSRRSGRSKRESGSEDGSRVNKEDLKNVEAKTRSVKESIESLDIQSEIDLQFKSNPKLNKK